MDTAPKDQAALRFGAQPQAPRLPRHADFLFEFASGPRHYRCELRDHGSEFGVEAQFLLDGELLHARTLRTRELAIAWAIQARRILERSVR